MARPLAAEVSLRPNGVPKKYELFRIVSLSSFGGYSVFGQSWSASGADPAQPLMLAEGGSGRENAARWAKGRVAKERDLFGLKGWAKARTELASCLASGVGQLYIAHRPLNEDLMNGVIRHIQHVRDVTIIPSLCDDNHWDRRDGFRLLWRVLRLLELHTGTGAEDPPAVFRLEWNLAEDPNLISLTPAVDAEPFLPDWFLESFRKQIR
jgi:hypothetical protein